MQVQVQDREGLFKALTVELKGEKVKKRLEDTYKRLQETVQVQGFRKGKAPLWIIKAKYKEAVEEEVGKQLADETLAEALKQAELTPVADIYLEEIKVDEKEGKLTYRVSFEVPPQFELKNPEELEVEVPKVEFKEEMVKERLEALRKENALWEPKEEEPAEEGDLLVLEYEVEEAEGEGEKEKVKQETSVILGQGVLRPEVEEALKGKKVGEEVYLENLPLYDQQGKEVGKVNIRIKVKEIKKQVLPELTDDFAKELGYESLKDLEEKVREEVKKSLESFRRQLLQEKVSDKLIEVHQFPVPKTLLRRELSLLLDRKLRELSAYGVDPRYVDTAKLARELEPVAEGNVKLRLILDRYAKEKGIEPSEEDVEEQYRALALQYNTTPEEVKKYFREQGLEEVVREDARRTKALREIMELVKVKEVEPQKEEVKEDEGRRR